MKQFIYLDIDIINSIIAQKEKGLALERSSEKENTQGQTIGSEERFHGGLSGEGNILNLIKLKSTIGAEDGHSLAEHSQELMKEIETKTLHDAAYDIAYSSIKNEYDLNPAGAGIGSFIEISRTFDFVDLEYIEGLFAPGSLLEYLKKAETTKIEAQYSEELEGINREQRRQNEQSIKKLIKEATEASNQKYDDISNIIKMIKQIIPYKRMLISSDGFLVSLEDQYFRDNPKTMGFKHGGELTCVGYITNIVGEANHANSGNVFSIIQHSVNDVLCSLLPSSENNIFMMHPVALYYGK